MAALELKREFIVMAREGIGTRGRFVCVIFEDSIGGTRATAMKFAILCLTRGVRKIYT